MLTPGVFEESPQITHRCGDMFRGCRTPPLLSNVFKAKNGPSENLFLVDYIPYLILHRLTKPVGVQPRPQIPNPNEQDSCKYPASIIRSQTAADCAASACGGPLPPGLDGGGGAGGHV